MAFYGNSGHTRGGRDGRMTANVEGYMDGKDLFDLHCSQVVHDFTAFLIQTPLSLVFNILDVKNNKFEITSDFWELRAPQGEWIRTCLQRCGPYGHKINYSSSA
jgi:hypothetical protein